MPLSQRYTNEASGVAISYPASWSVVGGGDFAVIGHATGTSLTIASELILRGSMTLDEFLALTLDLYLQGVEAEGVSLQETNRVQLEHGLAYIVDFEGSAEGLGVRSKLYVTLNEDRGVLLSFAFRESLVALHLPIIEAMLDSIQLFLPTGSGSAGDDHADDISQATFMNTPGKVTGIIENVFDIDIFSFQATAGERYRIDVMLGTLEDPLLSLFDKNGNLIIENDDFGGTFASQIRWTAPISGRYFLVVENAVLVSTGTYTLSIAIDTRTTPLPQAPGSSVSGIPLDPDARYGGVLIAAATGDGPTFSNWEEAAGIPDDVGHPLLNMLIRPRTWGNLEDYQNNAFFELHPDLATSWEQSEDGLKWTFHLRQGVTWSDGVPLTCADIKWSYDTIRTGEGLNRSPRAVHFLAVDNIGCTDDLTVVFNLRWPKPGLLEVIGMPYHVMRPKHIYDGNTALMRTNLPDVTSGPFTISQWIPGEKYTFKRNADYWDAPFPYLDGLEVNILSNSAQVTALRGGRLDVGAKQGWNGGRADTLLAECDVCTFWPQLISSSFSPGIMLNHRRAPWNDPAVKEAVALAFDNQKYIDTVTLGYAVLPTGCGFYPTGPWAMPEERCARIPGYGDIFEQSVAPRAGSAAADKKRARQILADAGYQPGDLKVTVVFWSVIQDNVPPILEDLQAIGIDATADIQETVRAYTTWSDGAFDMGVHSFWVSGLDPDVSLYEHFYTGSDRNYNRYSNPEFDFLVDRMSATLDSETRKQLAWDAMEIALRDQAKIIMAHGSYIPTFNKRVQGLLPALNYLAAYGPQARYDHTWVSE